MYAPVEAYWIIIGFIFGMLSALGVRGTSRRTLSVKHYTDGWQYQDCWQDGPEHYKCALHRIELLQKQQAETYQALNALAGYFRSGNQVPVERATLRTESPEIQRILALLKEAT